jgi:hypothetical protein
MQITPSLLFALGLALVATAPAAESSLKDALNEALHAENIAGYPPAGRHVT